jgi:phosphopantothenoylcysteine decarboxylase/phosphopantothenate--cysteine ligase
MKLLITAGPTREPIDRVRFISNRSSGKIGLALAQAGVDAGHQVTLLLGPGVDAHAVSPSSEVHRFETAGDLLAQLRTHFPQYDVLIMAAAVSDYRPVHPVDGKMPRVADESLSIKLEATPDIVATIAHTKRADQRIVAFALEQADQLEARASAKLRRKAVDAIVANPLSTMDGGDIDAIWLTAHGGRDAPGVLSKADFGRWLMAKIAGDLGLEP